MKKGIIVENEQFEALYVDKKLVNVVATLERLDKRIKNRDYLIEKLRIYEVDLRDTIFLTTSCQGFPSDIEDLSDYKLNFNALSDEDEHKNASFYYYY